jgi:hypothetical protein
MSKPQALALSQVETEALRALRTRLNKAPTSDAASATLGRAFFQVVARSDLAPTGDGAALDARLGKGAAGLLAAIAPADMAGLNALLAVLQRRLSASASDWRALQAAGVPQAVISRRLQLAGRESDPNTTA